MTRIMGLSQQRRRNYRRRLDHDWLGENCAYILWEKGRNSHSLERQLCILQHEAINPKLSDT